MKYAEVSGMGAAEIRKKIVTLKRDKFDAKMKNGLGQLQNPLSIRSMRRDIAKLKMALSMKAKKK